MAEDFHEFTDAQLTALAREGQGDAFAELSLRYREMIRKKARLFEGPSAPEKEDLWQEGLLGLYGAAVTYRPDSGTAFSTYAGVCVYNRMASAARKHISGGNRALNESVSLEDAASTAVREGPETHLEVRENFRAFQEKLDQTLTPLERRALALHLCGMGRQEAAQRAGVPLRTFDNALHRVRKKLKSL